MDKYEKIIEMPSVSEPKKSQVDTSPKIKERNFIPSISTILLTFFFLSNILFYNEKPN
jgi:hypothetical protein